MRYIIPMIVGLLNVGSFIPGYVFEHTELETNSDGELQEISFTSAYPDFPDEAKRRTRVVLGHISGAVTSLMDFVEDAPAAIYNKVFGSNWERKVVEWEKQDKHKS